MLNLLSRLCQQQYISHADYFFAKFIADKQQAQGYAELEQNLAILLAALCQHSLAQGNTCLFLDRDLAQNYFGLSRYRANEAEFIAEIEHKIQGLPPEQWAQQLQQHIAFSADPEHKITPLVFQYGALYFYRSWQDEKRLADYLKSAVEIQGSFDPQLIQQSLQRYFGAPQPTTNWQKIAVALALRQSFCLISGGPGTGKTYTVARLLAVLQDLHQGQLQIALAAPTGKAKARLKESIEKELNSNPLAQMIPAEQRRKMLQHAETLHALLGIRPFSEQPRYHQQNPLPYDVVIVDEASMIDLSLMCKLQQALAPNCKLILLGDKDQLASVEAGAILGSLGEFLGLYFDPQRQKEIGCYDADFSQYLMQASGESLHISQQPLPPLANHLCYLPDSRRFSQDSAIGQLAAAVNLKNHQAAEKSWHLLNQAHVDFQQGKIEAMQYQGQQLKVHLAQICATAVQKYRDYLLYLQQSPQIAQDENQLKILFEKFNSVRFLTALRGENFGTQGLNRWIAEALRAAELVSFQHDRDWYLGKPIMITKNDRNTQLANGDIGLYIGNNQICFDSGGEYKLISRNRIPSQFEPAFAMTVHKSQGSEFEHTILVLPTENNPVLSKELIYTAVTRAKSQFSVFCTENIWKTAVQKQSKRQSGLKFAIEQ